MVDQNVYAPYVTQIELRMNFIIQLDVLFAYMNKNLWSNLCKLMEVQRVQKLKKCEISQG